MADPPAGSVRIRMEGCGICASNLPVWQGRPWFRYPMEPGSPGHEGWGVIEEAGEGVGFLGASRLVDVSAVADPLTGALENLGDMANPVFQAPSFEEMLDCDLDAVVIATPSALHAQQTIRALEKGMAVFCQKPLGRSAEETQAAIDAARRANRLLGVDLSYRHVAAVQEIYRRIHEGCIGDVYAARLVFHNAYGPDKKWFYQRDLSGGGCVIDLGVHLVDMALWMLDHPAVGRCSSRLYAHGAPWTDDSNEVEDYATAQPMTSASASSTGPRRRSSPISRMPGAAARPSTGPGGWHTAQPMTPPSNRSSRRRRSST